MAYASVKVPAVHRSVSAVLSAMRASNYCDRPSLQRRTYLVSRFLWQRNPHSGLRSTVVGGMLIYLLVAHLQRIIATGDSIEY